MKKIKKNLFISRLLKNENKDEKSYNHKLLIIKIIVLFLQVLLVLSSFSHQ